MKPWTDDEDAALAAMAALGADVSVAGAVLGRSQKPGGATDRRLRSRQLRAEARPERRCPVCGTRLAAYNPGPRCYLHGKRS